MALIFGWLALADAARPPLGTMVCVLFLVDGDIDIDDGWGLLRFGYAIRFQSSSFYASERKHKSKRMHACQRGTDRDREFVSRVTRVV